MRIASLADIEALEAQPYDDVVDPKHLLDIFRIGAERYGNQAALTYLPKGDLTLPPETYSYADLYRKVVQAANLFRSSGVGPEDSVAILMPNIPEAHFALWGASIAARAAPMNHMLRPDHLIELLQAAKTKAIVALAPNEELDIWSRIPAIREALPDIQIFAGYAAAPDTARFSLALDEQPQDHLVFERSLGRDTPAAYFHTGGTTGAPKLAQHTHGNQVHTSWSAAVMYDLEAGEVMANGFPLLHVAGSFVYGLSGFQAGASLVLPGILGWRDLDFVANFWKAVETYGITQVACVPTTVASLMNVPVGDADISSIKLAWTGGTPLPSELAAAFEKKFGIPVRNIFGMTESAGLVSITPPAMPRLPGSTGLRLPYAEMKVAPLTADGPDPAKSLPPGETGVVMLKGPHVGPGYTDPARNPGTFTEDGWLISGDLGHIDADGQVFLTGRSKDVIIRGAHNIDPAVIEETIDQHPAVEMSAAVGQPDAYAGELPVVYVTLKAGQAATEDDLLAFLAERIHERPALPKRAIIVDAMPLTPVGKIYKPALRAESIGHVLAETLSVLEKDGVVTQVETVDTGKGITARIRIVEGGPGADAFVTEALRDFALDYKIERG